MSWLRFIRGKNLLELFAGNGVGTYVSPLVGSWPAHNETAASSGGAWPSGTFKWLTYKRHVDQAGFGPG
jgi:hypothetical protein